MNSGSNASQSGSGDFTSEQRRLCLEHAGDLIACAERVLGGDNSYANIAYHLALLALEEIGKAGMLSAKAAVGTAMDPEWLEKRLDRHIFKLLWALWSPTMLSGKVDPDEFLRAREFAERLHERRLAGLYFDFGEDSVPTPPRDAISLRRTMSILALAKSSLELELARTTPVKGEQTEELIWYLDALNDEFKHKVLFSKPFLAKAEEIGGDARAWLRWARAEIEQIEAAGRETLQREMARKVDTGKTSTPKWLIKVRLYTPTHSVRQKVLNQWNDRVYWAKLRAVDKKSELLMELIINDNVPIADLFDEGMMVSKLHIAMLNIGSGGVFWFELSSQTQAYFEKVEDLEFQMEVKMAKRSGLAKEWIAAGPGGRKFKRSALEKAHMENAMTCLAAFAPMTNDEAEPIFGQYFTGVTMLCKTDLHLGVEKPARNAFVQALRNALQRFGDWNGDEGNFKAGLSRAIESCVPDEAHRRLLCEGLDVEPAGKVALPHAMEAKMITDLYLAIVARRLVAERLKGGAKNPPASLATDGGEGL